MKNPRYGMSVVMACVLALACSTAQAAWDKIDDFDGLTLGPINGQNGWAQTRTAGSSDVAADPTDAGNQVLRLAGDSSSNWTNAVKATGISDATGIKTLTWRVRFDYENLWGGTGATAKDDAFRADGGNHVHAPVNVRAIVVGDPENTRTYVGRAAGGTGFARTENDTPDADLAKGNWYTIWTVLDPANSFYNAYVLGGQFTEQTPLLEAATYAAELPIINPDANDPLDQFVATMKLIDTGATQANLYVDDIYVDTSGENLTLAVGPAPVAGDYNGDGVVDPSDYAFWSNQYAAELGGGSGDLAADGNGDGVIDPSDYAFWSNEYAATLGGGSAVPEPISGLLLGLGGLAVLRRRRMA